MKYVVITSKHHDGFALYDSAASDWNAVKSSPAGRDLLAPLAEAVRANGLKFGLYSKAKKWIVTAEVAATKPVKLLLTVGKSKKPTTVDIPATGEEKVWKTVPLGTIALPAGESSIELEGVPEKWNPIEVRQVTLTPEQP